LGLARLLTLLDASWKTQKHLSLERIKTPHKFKFRRLKTSYKKDFDSLNLALLSQKYDFLILEDLSKIKNKKRRMRLYNSFSKV
jgi:hypothetical protein